MSDASDAGRPAPAAVTTPTSPGPLALATREAAVAMVAALVSAGVLWAIGPDPGRVVFAIFLTIALSRSQLERDLRGRLEAGIALPLIALGGAAVGMLLMSAPWAGATVYALAMGLSVLLRRYGPLWRRMGSLLALPFTVLLIAPAHDPSASAGANVALALIAGVICWAVVTAAQLAARRLHILPTPARTAEPASPRRTSASDAAAAPRRRWDATTRLAVQLTVATALAFTVGYLLFPTRWSWIVTTTLVVSLGNAGRADVVYKAVQRTIGAAVGSALAAAVLIIPRLPIPLALGIVVVVLFAGLVLRRFAYLWWTLAVTLALAVSHGVTTGPFPVWQREEEILVGAVLAVLVAWFLAPVRSEGVLRRRVGGVLATLAADPADAEARQAALTAVGRTAAPFDALRRFLPRAAHPRAARWIVTTREIAATYPAEPTPAMRRTLGQARRSLREPEALQESLDALLAAFRAAPPRPAETPEAGSVEGPSSV